MIKNNINKILEELQQASKFPLEKMFNNHDNCSTKWCFKKRASVEGNAYNDKDDEFCYK